MSITSMTSVSRSVQVAAPAERVWALLSDLPRMGELSPENTGGRWRGGATGPALGARFRGSNRNGWRRWSTDVEVTRCEPGTAFAFDVSSFGIPVARWAYEVVADGPAACTVTESMTDQRPGWFSRLVGPFTGRPDRSAFTAESIEITLKSLKAAAEG